MPATIRSLGLGNNRTARNHGQPKGVQLSPDADILTPGHVRLARGIPRPLTFCHMSRRLRCLAVVLLSVSLGCHWALMQGVAWVAMFADHVRTEPVPVALTRTFDGEHPCEICKVVQAGRAAERQDSAQLKLEKLEPVPLASPSLQGFPEAAPVKARPSAKIWQDRTGVPPVPPPRSLPTA
jgi:hypothetical protein